MLGSANRGLADRHGRRHLANSPRFNQLRGRESPPTRANTPGSGRTLATRSTISRAESASLGPFALQVVLAHDAGVVVRRLPLPDPSNPLRHSSRNRDRGLHHAPPSPAWLIPPYHWGILPGMPGRRRTFSRRLLHVRSADADS